MRYSRVLRWLEVRATSLKVSYEGLKVPRNASTYLKRSSKINFVKQLMKIEGFRRSRVCVGQELEISVLNQGINSLYDVIEGQL